jgi:hypothetical protein
MISMKKTLIGALIGAGLIAGSTGGASAYVACNRAGDCWHTESRYAYDRNLGVRYHPDDWYFHQHWDGRNHYRDYHEGRGGYRNGIWFSF